MLADDVTCLSDDYKGRNRTDGCINRKYPKISR